MKQYTDEELLAQYLQGNDKAFSVLAIRYNQPIFSYIMRYLNDRDASHDLVQETFIRVIKNIKKFRENSLFRPWIYTIATNLVRNAVRNKKKRSEISAQNFDFSVKENQIDKAILAENIEKLNNCLQQLSQTHREIFTLRFYQKLSFEEIATITNCKVNTARTRMFYALQKIRNLFEEN